MLFGETVYDNLKFPYLLRKIAVDEEEISERFRLLLICPMRFLNKGINELSGGEKQRISHLSVTYSFA